MAIHMPMMVGGHPVPVLRPGTTQVVAYTATAAATSNGVGSGTEIVRLVADSDCHYVVGSDPTATTSDPFLPSGVVEFIQITPGQKVSFIQNSAGGNAYVTEMS